MNGLESPDIRPLIVIPVYNHAATLREVAIGALNVCPDVLVIDDGSTDGSSEGIRGLPVRFIAHKKNMGKGAAILTAAKEAGRLGMTHIITIDADGQHDPADLSRFIPVIRKSPLAIVVGERAFDRKTTPLSSRFGRKFSNFWLRVETGISLKDTQSGFRAYPVAVLQWLKLRDRRYSFEIEVLVKAAWAGIELKETDISCHYPDPSERISHFHVFKDNLALSLLNTRLSMRAVLPLPHRQFTPAPDGSDRLTALHPLQSLKILFIGCSSRKELALSGGLGVFIGSLPLIACQTVTILIAASYLRLNKLTAVCTSQLCIPPIVPGLCIEVGYFVRHGRFLTELSLKTLGYQGLERIFEWIIGSLILGPALGLAATGIIYILAVFIKKEALETNG